MGFSELLEKVKSEIDADIEKIRQDALLKKKQIIEEAQKKAQIFFEEAQKQAQKKARLLKEEIISAGRIKSKAILRDAKISAINEIFNAFQQKVLEDKNLKKEIYKNFIEKNFKKGETLKVTKEVFELLKKEKTAKMEIYEDKVPISIEYGNVRICFDWDEFFEKVKEAAISKVK